MREITGAVIMVAVLLAFVLGMTWFKSHNEAVAYRKYCDTPVTTWEAVFLDLRIDECKKCED